MRNLLRGIVSSVSRELGLICRLLANRPDYSHHMAYLNEQNTLRFWHAVEHLSPFDLDQAISQAVTEKRVYFTIPVGARDQDLPWLSEAKRRALRLPPDRGFRYRLYFGVFKSAAAVKALRETFGGEEPVVRYENKQNTCYGSFDVSDGGRVLPGALALSTLPWAVGYLGDGSLDENLAAPDWDWRFRGYSSSIFTSLSEEADGMWQAGTPLDAEALGRIVDGVISASGWRPPRAEALAYCVAYEEKRWREPPPGEVKDAPPANDTNILNSFFIDELERVHAACGRGDVGKALAAYLSDDRPEIRSNLDDREQLKPWLSPRHTPAGRWPSEDTCYQSLMQQAAVNLAGIVLGDDAGLFSVNGPPGTGKTTMLRDIIADIVVRRAERLARFASPHDAFTVAEEVPVSQDRVVTLYRPDQSLTGFEIVVASSNNGAVENITEEIPAGKAVDGAYRADAAYFARVASYVIGTRGQELPPWGMVAAVLGKSANLNEFVDKFWFDMPTEDKPRRFSFRHHLSEVTPTLAEWKEAQVLFRRARGRVRDLTEHREALARAVAARPGLAERLSRVQAELYEAQEGVPAADEAAQRAGDALEGARKELERRTAHVQAVALDKPSWLDFLLAWLQERATVTEYRRRMGEVQRELERARAAESEREREKGEADRAVTACREKAAGAAAAVRAASEAVRENERLLEEGRRELGSAFADDEWWARGEEKLQLRAPWLDDRLNKARAKLFVAALRLHQAFAEVARAKIRPNLELWVRALRGGVSHLDESLIRHLWQTFFLVVPVVSTTFASVGRMFRRLGRESLGWLLIDEAGQATPQAAVGALWRARRAVVVGDPLQIEPVFGVEESVVERIRHHCQAAARWSPLVTSAQAVADRVNPYGTHVSTDLGDLWVGCPLRVHRRCVEPMFGIANRIAYGGKMVLATRPAPPDESFPLGKSRWVNIAGECESGHVVREQCEYVLGRLREAARAGDFHKRLFVISPFRDVADELTRLVVGRRHEWLPGRQTEEAVKRWARRSIGTVHTFQGKEADVVILVLGADEQTEGAARWAAERPNILNVAATRARYRFYVVGNAGLWGKLNYFRVAYSLLPAAAG
jgi:AAA domain